MGSATREAVAAAKAAIAARPDAAKLAVGDEIFSAGRAIGASAQLLGALTDPAAAPEDKATLVNSVFRSLGKEARELLTGLAQSRWSEASDFLFGVEELGLRVMADSVDSKVDISAELFAFGQLVQSNAELELAVGSKLGDPSAKAALIASLLDGRASPQTVSIISHLVQQPLGRRIGALLKSAADIIADQKDLAVATVTAASPLGASQLEKLRKGLSAKYGALRINQIVDPSILGGVRVAVGSDVIDDSVATRLKELKLQLVG